MIAAGTLPYPAQTLARGEAPSRRSRRPTRSPPPGVERVSRRPWKAQSARATDGVAFPLRSPPGSPYLEPTVRPIRLTLAPPLDERDILSKPLGFAGLQTGAGEHFLVVQAGAPTSGKDWQAAWQAHLLGAAKNPSGNNRIGPCRQGRASSQAICCS
jgi:hypothetical protein